ncbi:hypothetical protein FA13DRAFT_1730536 [Coprinellus micaceus]|uniref:SMODS and SLOG-associating 2TM effector domain-containing protein n=1 Tax=Coprinellus micaceus TaxID=71717 RepID=A0A4Y7TJ49_COPMI|nr:hypothetical protein FA13DRAFT_1730536 [Coprinellus micaceus]
MESRVLRDTGELEKDSRTRRDYGEPPQRSDAEGTSPDHHIRSGSSRVPSGATTILLDAPLPSLPRDDRIDNVQGLRRPRTRETNSTLYSNRPLPPSRQHSGIDWLVPVDMDEKSSYSRARRKLTSREKFAKRARYTKYIQNTAIGLQVLLGSLTTGLSAVATTGRQTGRTGGLTTIVASYLAKTRNSDEPELSRTRVKDLDKFIRTSTSFLLDFGHSDDPIHDKTVEGMRNEFEELLGNGTIEKNPAPPAV